MISKLKSTLSTLALGVLLILGAMPLQASSPPENACDLAARRAGQDWGIPLNVLRALTRTETGRTRNGRFEPWPWTVNVEGAGRWFASRDEAQKYAYQQYKLGYRSFDLGCFQINYKWHGQAFSSLDAMVDPQTNADYAASFLQRLYEEFGSWPAAAAAYHSRTPEYATAYRSRFERIFAALDAAPGSQTPASRMAQANKPKANVLLIKNQGSSPEVSLGSLVPVGRSASGGLWFSLQAPS